MELPECIFKDSADVVAVLMSLIVSDDLKKLVFAQCLATLLPPPLPPRQSQSEDERFKARRDVEKSVC